MPYVNGMLVNLVSNPELKASQSGKYICVFRVANNYGYGDNKRTDFIKCAAFGKTAETINNHLHKGDAVIIQGEFHDRSYQKNDKGYDIPNWQYDVQSIVFLPKAKSTEHIVPDGYEEVSPADVFTAKKSGSTDFEGIEEPEGTGDLPF